jgi:hypothetical protein
MLLDHTETGRTQAGIDAENFHIGYVGGVKREAKFFASLFN